MRLIDADALLAELQKDANAFDDEAEDARKNSRNYTDGDLYSVMGIADGIRDAMMEVYDAPTIEPKHGEWVADIKHQYHYRCSNCGILAQSECKIWNFCPNCGARMVKDE